MRNSTSNLSCLLTTDELTLIYQKFNRLAKFISPKTMRSNIYDEPFKRYSRYAQQTYNSEEGQSDEYMKTFVQNIRQEVSKNQILYRQSGKKSSSKKKSKKQPTSDDQRFPWQDRYKGKTKERQFGQKYMSQKQKLKAEQKNIEYETIFRELYYGNSTDQVEAALLYNEILESIVFYLMNKELEMDLILTKKKPSEAKKEEPSKVKTKVTKAQPQIKQEEPKQQTQTKKQANANEGMLQIPDSQLEQSIEVPIKQGFIKKEEQKIIQQGLEKKEVRPFESDDKFVEDFERFKRCSSLTSLISLIPYKSIPSLFLVSSLKFIISKTTQPIAAKYFSLQDPFYRMYKELNSIAQSSRKYLIEEKLLKGLNYISDVQKKLDSIYVQKNSFKPKTVIKNESAIAQTVKQEAYNQCEERKSSTRSEESPIIEERKEETEQC